MKKKYPYSRQYLDNKDISTVIKTLKSDVITRGNKVIEFENKVSKFCKAKYAVAVNSATSALHISCLALGVKKDDLVWTVPNTFAASANAALYCGAKIDFVDIEWETGNMDLNKLENKLKNSKKKPKIIIPVHFSGQPTDQEKIFKLSRKYKFKILEDASHSIGARRNDNKVGNCKWSDITIFSFHPVKIITTGEGGMALSNNKRLFEKLKLYRNHGVTRDPALLKKKNISKWYYEQIELGYNYWISDINASLGISQLKKINKFIKKRNEIAKIYNRGLQNLPIYLPIIKKGNLSTFHLYVIKLKNYNTKYYNNIFSKLLKKGIDVNLHYLPVHLHPYYKKLGFKSGDFPISEKHAKSAISLPIYFDLNKKQLSNIIKTLKKIIN